MEVMISWQVFADVHESLPTFSPLYFFWLENLTSTWKQCGMNGAFICFDFILAAFSISMLSAKAHTKWKLMFCQRRLHSAKVEQGMGERLIWMSCVWSRRLAKLITLCVWFDLKSEFIDGDVDAFLWLQPQLLFIEKFVSLSVSLSCHSCYEDDADDESKFFET